MECTACLGALLCLNINARQTKQTAKIKYDSFSAINVL